MIRGMNLAEYFTDIAYKRLSAVEANPKRSNQHEFNGVGGLKNMLGENKREFIGKFAYLAENEPEPVTADIRVTWYDARENHQTRTEYRLYYQDSPLNEYMREGDLMVVGKRPSGDFYFFIAQKNSTYANQIALLFELPDEIDTTAQVKDFKQKLKNVDFVKSFILSEIGIEIEQTDENYLELILGRFPAGFPPTVEFSEFARNTLPFQNIEDDPDAVLMSWMEREELLFLTLEQHLLVEKVKNGFEDVDKFINLSLSIQNRRKSRVGHALENHLETIFAELKVSFSRGKETENNSKPDFIFPNIERYHDVSFSEERLFMLGAKSTCKDRWRQVLAEAARIKKKHLLTLEPGISTNQTDEMIANSLQLVIPKSLFGTYTNVQQKWLITLKDFIEMVRG